MRRLVAASTEGLERLSPIVWTSAGEDAAFEFVIDPAGGPFLCFFLAAKTEMMPLVAFDEGEGFSDITALGLKSFPFAFYHVSLDRLRAIKRLRFRPCDRSANFRFLAFQTRGAVFVAILHFLFNLRYQKISLVTADAKGRPGRIQAIKSNVERIAKFFADVRAGSGVRVQEGSQELLPILKIAMSLKAVDVQERMSERFAGDNIPLISFIAPTYQTPPDYLRDLVDSFTVQQAPYAELILSDDGSTDGATLASLSEAAKKTGVQLVCNPINRGIAATTNAGIAKARGHWIAFIDHDDAFVPGAIAIIADAIVANPQAVFFYTDEIVVDGTLKPIGSFLKPAYDSVLLSGSNYINHFSIFPRERLTEIGGLREDREGSQDYDLLLRSLRGAAPDSIVHIPYLAYMWRRDRQTYSVKHVGRSVDNARLALVDAYAAEGQTITVAPALDPNLHRIQFAQQRPSVSVVIPSRDSLGLIRRVVADLLHRTRYAPIEIVIVDNGSTDKAVLGFYATLDPTRVRVDIVAEPFNFSRMCNRGAALATGDAVLFLNNDIEVREEGWLEEMVECLSFEATGIVGAKLLYPNGALQHVGVIVGLGDAAGHWFVERPADEPGPMGRLHVRQTMTAVTGACMLVTRACLEATGGFDELAFPVAYNDIDLCVRARDLGFRTVWTPFACLTHHESLTRGSDATGESQARFEREKTRLQDRHRTKTFSDDAYNPNFDRRYSIPTIVVADALHPPRPGRFS